MSEKELKMFDVDAQLDAVFGKEGTPERKAAEDRANVPQVSTFYRIASALGLNVELTPAM